MTILGKLLAAAILFVVAARVTATAAHAVIDFPSRTSVYFTEPQMVHLSRQVQTGGSVCPEWREFPHVVNVFTPGYFLLVGGAGKAAGVSLDSLPRIGRGVTLAFTVLGAVLTALAVRRLGRVAMLAAGGLTIASGVMMGFGWMVRPDVTSDVLGFAGFLGATSAAPMWIPVAVLGAAMFCKQTAVLYVAAAALALGWQSQWRRAAIISAGSMVCVVIALGALWLSGERRAFADVFLESSSPWKWDHWKTVSLKILSKAGDAVMLAFIGAFFWIASLRRGGPIGSLNSNAAGMTTSPLGGEVVSTTSHPSIAFSVVSSERTDAIRWLSLLALAAVIGVVGSAKLGSDVNYYLPLRFVAAAAAATVIAELCAAKVRWRWLAAGVMSLLALVYWSTPVLGFLQRQFGPPELAERRAARKDAWDREIDGVVLMSRSKRVLTNCDDAALRIGNPFVDSFVFKMMVDDGRLNPTLLKERIARGDYDWIITTAEVDDPNYIASTFGMPKELADVIVQRYEKAFRQALIYYRPRRE